VVSSRNQNNLRQDWTLVIALGLVGVALRGAYLLRVPPFLDEYSSMLTGISILRSGGLPVLPSGVLYPSGSLFSYIEAAFFSVFGFSDGVARLPSLLIGAFTLPILFVLARGMLGRRAALLAVAMLALAPEAVVWGGRARMYALLQLLVLLTTYFFYTSVLFPVREGPKRQWPAWLWVVSFWAAIFAQDEAILLLPFLWGLALLVRGAGWFFRPANLIGQVLVPTTGVVFRFWLNEIRVPGDVYVLVHDSFFRFPPALVHGLQEIAPFFLAPWAWPVSIFFLWALITVVRNLLVLDSRPDSQPDTFVAYQAILVLGVASVIVLVVNTPWQGDRYLFMLLPQFLTVAAWGLDQALERLAQRWMVLRQAWLTPILVLAVACLLLPAGFSALRRFEPDYSAAYRWVATQIEPEDLVVAIRPAPAAVYLGRCDFLAAEDKHQEFIMRLNGVWVDRWAGARVVDSPDAFRQETLETGKKVWFVVDEDRFESTAYSAEFVSLVWEQMDIVWREGGVLVFQGQGFHPLPSMTVAQSVDVNFGNQLRLSGYALNTDQPTPGQELVLQLLWQAVAPERDYTVFVHILDAEGQGLVGVDAQPLGGLYSMTTHWPRDRVVRDTRRLMIPEDVPPGRYPIEVGLYDGSAAEIGLVPLLDSRGNLVGDRARLDYLAFQLPEPSEPAQPVDGAVLGAQVRLEGYAPPQPLQVAAGSTLPISLTWECLGRMQNDYTVFVHLVEGSGPPQAQGDGPPLAGSYPTSFWDVGERLVDPHVVSIPADLPAGTYDLQVGMYLLETGERLPLLGTDGRVLGDSILLGPVIVTLP